MTVLILYLVCRRANCGEKHKERIQKLKQMIFFNPFIKYSFVNSLKFNMTAVLVFNSFGSKSAGQCTVAVLTFLLFVSLPFLYARLLFKNHDKLDQADFQNKFGTMFKDKGKAKREKKVVTWSAPIFFFLRRTCFILASVLLMERPAMQMIIHQGLTLVAIVYLIHQQFNDGIMKGVEIASEGLLLLVSACIQQCMRVELSEDVVDNANTAVMWAIYTLIGVNVCFMIFSAVKNCKAKRHLKQLEKQRQENIKKAQQALAERLKQSRM